MQRKLLTSPAWLAAILLFSFLPTLTFVGHWEEIVRGTAVTSLQMPASGAIIFDAVMQQADQARHAMHCHTNLGSCSEQPMPAGVGLFASRETRPGPPPALVAARLQEVALVVPGPAFAPLLPPPRSA